MEIGRNQFQNIKHVLGATDHVHKKGLGDIIMKIPDNIFINTVFIFHTYLTSSNKISC